MQLDHPITFLKGYFQNPRSVGSLFPSSRALASAICKPYQDARRRCVLLEVGAGTGPITKHLGRILGPSDELDVCELNDDFADVLEQHVLTNEDFASATAQGRVRLLRIPAQNLKPERQYDYVICGLPFNAFDLADVRETLAAIRRCMKPGAVFSYYEYAWLRKLSAAFAFWSRSRYREVSKHMSENIVRYQFRRDTILMNVPPAHVRHLRFDH